MRTWIGTKVSLCLILALAALTAPLLAQELSPPPTGKELKALVKEYFAADEEGRIAIRKKVDESYRDLKPGPEIAGLRKEILKYASKNGRKIARAGSNYFLDKKNKRGRYIVRGRPKKALFIGLHGGGLGSGDAGNMAGAMGGGGWWWIFPEVIEKTEHGWTTSGTEEFVMDLIDAAKRTGKVDPNQIYISGHSMGGFGSWHLGAHHADVFAGIAPYAGAPTPVWEGDPKNKKVQAIEPGVLPNLYNLRVHIFQSLDDRQVTPEANVFAAKALKEWRLDHPKGFDFRYMEVEKRGHAAPKEGYLPSQKWVAQKHRDPRPKKILWQPSLKWKKHFYWLYWHRPVYRSLIQVEAKPDNKIEVTGLERANKIRGLTILVGEPMVDPKKEIQVIVNGSEAFKGKARHQLSTLLLTMVRHDKHLLFDARVDLGPNQ